MRKIFGIRTGFVYFIQMDRIGPIKIGFAKDVLYRVSQLQTANPYQLNVLAFFAGDDGDEKQIQCSLKDANIRGEWFHPTEKVLGYVDMAIKLQAKDTAEINDGRGIVGDFRIGSDWWNNESERSLN